MGQSTKNKAAIPLFVPRESNSQRYLGAIKNLLHSLSWHRKPKIGPRRGYMVLVFPINDGMPARACGPATLWLGPLFHSPRLRHVINSKTGWNGAGVPCQRALGIINSGHRTKNNPHLDLSVASDTLLETACPITLDHEELWKITR
jgi:hypothetical protein